MKKLKYLVFAIIAGIAVSCSNETLIDDIAISSEDIQTRAIADNPVNIQTVAELMSCIELNEAIVSEVKAGIDRSFKYGLGYNFRFNDLLKPKESKLIRTLNINNGIGKCANIMNFSSDGQIDKVLQVNKLIRSDWPKAEVDNGLVILEKDGGKDKKDSRILRYDEITNNTYYRKNVTVEYSYEKKDERIMNTVWERSMICSDLNYAPNGDLRKNYGLDNDFWITLKYFE